MSGNSYKSFEGLGKDLAKKGRAEAPSSAPGGAISARPAGPRGAAKRREPELEPAAENELFAQAMSRVTPIGQPSGKERGKGGRHGERADEAEGFALLAGLLPAGEAPKGAKKSRNKYSDMPKEIKDARPHTGSAPAGQGARSGPVPGEDAISGPSKVLDEEARFAATMLSRAAQEEQGREPDPELSLFDKAMRDVRPIFAKGRELPPDSKAKPRSASATDPAQALHDLVNGKLEFALQLSDEYLEGFVTGMDPLVMGKLRAGQYSPEAHLDLHGQNSEQAFNSLIWFIKNAYNRNLRTVLIVTGRGKNSPEGIGVLRNQLQSWLTKEPFKRVVLAFCTALANEGGPGAVYVLLRKRKKNHGKILWEREQYDVQ